MPSNVTVSNNETDAFPVAEPPEHPEEIVLYGKRPLSLETSGALVNACVFYIGIRIKYPKEWDIGADISFADRIANCVRNDTPKKLIEHRMPDNTAWTCRTEDDYQLLRKCFKTY